MVAVLDTPSELVEITRLHTADWKALQSEQPRPENTTGRLSVACSPCSRDNTVRLVTEARDLRDEMTSGGEAGVRSPLVCRLCFVLCFSNTGVRDGES